MVTNGVLILCCIGAFCFGWLCNCIVSEKMKHLQKAPKKPLFTDKTQNNKNK